MKTKRVHKLLALLLALMMTFSLLPTVTWATEKEEEEYVFQGSGTETDPYLIGDYTALKALATKVNGGWDTDGLYFRQTADIDMSEDTKWAPIAPIAAGKCDTPFNGTYDGDGHRIKNFVYNDPSRYYYGLFGKLGSNSVLKNLSLDESCSITGLSWVGGLACSSDGYIINCANYGTVSAAGSAGSVSYLNLGGIVGVGSKLYGCANYGTVTGNPDATNFGDVPGGMEVGGVAGNAYTLVNCANYGDVSGGGKVGGIVGSRAPLGDAGVSNATWGTTYSNIVGCANYGTVTAREMAGGIVGELRGRVEDCFNLGTVKVEKTVLGGIVGTGGGGNFVYKLYVYNCYDAGSVQYGAEEAEPMAGHLIGQSEKHPAIDEFDASCLYYQDIGLLPAVGDRDVGDAATAMKLEDMKTAAFVDALNDYPHPILRGMTWKQGGSESSGLPVFAGFGELKNWNRELKKLTLNGKQAWPDGNGGFYYVFPAGSELTNVTVNATIADGASIVPASGSVLDFSGGPVTFTVTAENGKTCRYSVRATAAASADGLAALKLGTGYMNASTALKGDILLSDADFEQAKTDYKFTRYDSEVLYGGTDTSIYNKYRIWAFPAESGATLKVKMNNGTATTSSASSMEDADARYVSYDGLMALGQNDLTLTVSPPTGGSGKETDYRFHLNVLPSLKSVSFAESGLEWETFAYNVQEYALGVPKGVTSLTPTVAAALGDTVNVTYSPALDADGKVKISDLPDGKLTITVSGKNAGDPSTTYIWKVLDATYDVSFNVNVPGATVWVYQGSNDVQTAENGVYTLRFSQTYRYVVTAKGYVSQSGALNRDILTDGVLNVTLSPAPANSLPQYGATWPSFRGNDENMALTDIKTPIGPYAEDGSDVELLWASASGSGYDSGAVGCPIFVDGYMYAYAGEQILKLDPTSGKTLLKKPMIGSSNFAIVPPTYGDGMIFVGLRDGQVQAFSAETLESLWVYKDPLGGQPNCPITYSDGYIYTGFWQGESGMENFVCLAVDDEDPSQPKESKEALWRYTSQGGFYWAGAYANENYVMVGTDDGKSGYTSGTAKFVVFDKRTGEIMDSKTGYTGDIRSNIAYDKETGRVFFTSKGGYFYSEVVGADGKIDTTQSKAVSLGGMSTSTPVVYNGRAYVGVAGTKGQFTPYGGHNISVIDLSSWRIAYTATTQGYPQTSGLVCTGYDDGVYVYFMDNYTPGVMRVIRDKPGQTALEGGVTEEFTYKGVPGVYKDCAPVVFTPEGPLAQYCIGSPVTDQYGTLYFKNDTGNLIALTSKVEELVVTRAPSTVEKGEDGSWYVEGAKLSAKLANGLERDVTELVTYRDDKKGGVEAVYTYGSSAQPYTFSVKTVSLTAAVPAPSIGNGTAEGETVDGVTTFPAGTASGAPTITVTAPKAGWSEGTNTFTVASSNDAACVVLVKRADGSYERLTADNTDGKHRFTASFGEGDSIIVALKGDVNGDGKISAADASQTKAAINGKLSLEGYQLYSAIVSGGTRPRSADVSQIRASITGKISLSW